MKHTSIFNTALRRLTVIYIGLAFLVTLSFTIPPLVASERARQRAVIEEWPPAMMMIPEDTDPLFGQRLRNFVERRDSDYRRDLGTTLIEINAVMLLLAILAGYYLARRSLNPLKEVLSTQEQFAAELAHELKTPLATVLMELEAFARTSEGLSAKQKKELRQMARSIKDVGTLSEQTLSLMAVEYTDQSVEMVAVNLTELATEAVVALQPLAKEKQINLIGPSIDVDYSVKGRATELKQIITILLDNAIKFSPLKGEVKVLVGEGQVTVIDSGPGVPKGERAKIFQRWYQADDGQDGSGLGLAIAKRIAEAHGGTLTVRNQKGGGAAFTFIIPRS